MNRNMVLTLFGVLLLCAAAFIVLGLPLLEEPTTSPQSSGKGGYEMQYTPPEGLNILDQETPDATSALETGVPEDASPVEKEPSQETTFSEDSEDSEAPEPEQDLCETLGLPKDKCSDDNETLTLTNLDDEEVSLDGISFSPDEDDEKSGKRKSRTRKSLVVSNVYDTQLTDLTFSGEGGEVTLKEVPLSDIPGESELSEALILEKNLIGVDSENYPELDHPARIKFVGLPGLKNVYPLKNGVPCGSDCSDFSYDPKTGKAYMDVSGFSTYSIEGIAISQAEHLDSSYGFISDITEDVIEMDGVWSEQIPYSHYVRATFEENLTNGKKIDLYVRKGGASNVYINIYLKDTTTLIGSTGPLTDAGEFLQIKVQNLVGKADTFDIKIEGDSGGYAEFDYIHDYDCVTPYDDMYLNETTYICEGDYQINDSGDVGVIIFNNDSMAVICENGNVTITGNGAGVGFYIVGGAGRGYNATLINCTIDSYAEGIRARSEGSDITDSALYNNTILNSPIGIRIWAQGNHHYRWDIANNTIINSTTYGLYLYSYDLSGNDQYYYNVTNNTVRDSSYAVYMNRKNYYHNFTNNSFFNITNPAVTMCLGGACNDGLDQYLSTHQNEFGNSNTIDGNPFYYYYNRSDETFENLNLNASNVGTSAGLFTCMMCKNITFKNNELDSAWNAGALFVGVDGLTVEYNNVSNSGQSGADYTSITNRWKASDIVIYNTTNPVARFNRVHSSPIGIYFLGDYEGFPTNYNLWAYNNSAYNESIGIDLRNNQDGRVINNTIWDTDDAGIHLDGDDNTVVNYNQIDESADGIRANSAATSVTDSTIYKNTIRNSTSGIKIHAQGNNHYRWNIANNTITNATSYGLYLYSYDLSGYQYYYNVTNNTIQDTPYGAYMNRKNYYHNFTNNAFYNTSGFAVTMCLGGSCNSGLDTYLSTWQNEIGPTNTINGSPIRHYFNHSNEVFENLDLDADNVGTNTGLFTCVKCENITFKNNDLESAEYAGAIFVGNINLTVENNNISYSNRAGATYGWPWYNMWKCAGIAVFNSTDPVVRFNNVDSSTFGIFFLGAYGSFPTNLNHVAYNNSIYNTSIGIEVKNNQRGRIFNNTVSDASDAAIRIDKEDYSNVTENIVSESVNGIHLFNDATNNRVIDNTFYNTSTSALRLRTTGTGSGGTPQYNILENNTIINATQGIHLYDSKNNNFTTNDINDTTDGIYFAITGTDIIPNNFVGNRIYNASNHGVYFQPTSTNWGTGYLNALRNYFYCDNYYDGEIFCHFYDVHNATFEDYYGSAGYDGNASNDATDFGMITLLESSNFSMTNLTLTQDGEYGMIALYSDNITFINGNASDNGDSGYDSNIRFYFSDDPVVHNTTMDNGYYGVTLDNSNWGSVSNCSLSNNSIYGIFIRRSHDTLVENNTLSDNPTHIALTCDIAGYYSSLYNEVISSNIMYGGEYGIYPNRAGTGIYTIRNITVSDNSAENVSNTCYYMRPYDGYYRDFLFERNNCTNSTYGFYIQIGNNIDQFTNNTFDTSVLQDVDYGIYQYLDTNNYISSQVNNNVFYNFDINASVSPLRFRLDSIVIADPSINFTLANFSLRNDVASDFLDRNAPQNIYLDFTNISFHRNLGSIYFNYLNFNGNNSIDSTNTVLDSDIASIDSTVHDYFQTEANVSLYTLNCPAGIYWKTGFPATAFEIVTTGAACPGGRCYDEVCSSNLVNFTVSNFSGYSALEIHAPYVENVTLNSTWDTNLTTENLTVYYDAFDPDMGEIRNTTNWYVDDVSLMALNFPFGVGSNSTWTQDYTDYGNNGTVSGATWNATGDFDGWGTYEFSGSSQYIFSPNTPSLSITGPITLEVWGKFDSVSGTRAILSKYDAGANLRSYQLEIDGANCAAGQVAFYIMPLGTTTGGAARCSNTVLTTGTWHHIVARYVPSGVMEIYIDGVDQTGTMGYGSYVPDSIFASSRGLAIGGSFSSSALPDTAWLDGTLSKVRIYNRTLSPEQIILLYNNVTDTMHHHDTRQDEIWRACVTPNDMLIDGTMNCSNNLTISRIGMENVTVASSSGTNTSDENITVSYDLFNGSAIGITNWYVDDVPTLNLYLPFEGYDGDPGVAKDYSPHSINGTLRDLTWNATMHNGRPGYDFDSTSDYIMVPRTAAAGLLDTGKFTLEVWANPDTYPADRGEMISTVQDGGYSLGLFPDGTAYFRIDVGSYTDVSSAYAVSTGEWHHIVATFDESTGNAKIYVDGTLNGSSTLVGTYDPVGGAFCIGEQSGGASLCDDAQNFDGQISLVRYWNRTLTPEQVASLYGDYDGDTISSDETEIGEVWKSCVLPNGDWEDSLNPEVCANLTIETPSPPIVENVTLNSTLGTNYTNEDLTVWYDSFSPEGYEVKNLTTWFLTNGSVTNKSIMTLLLPFEGGTEAERGRDYTSYEHNVTSVNSMTYYPNGGYDSWGVYGCQASTSVYMELNNSAMDGLQDFTIMMWVNKSSIAGALEAIISGAGASGSNEFLMYSTSTSMRVYLRGSYDTFTGFDLGQNEWHHIAFKRTANQGEFFVDGVSMGTATVSTATLDIGGCAPTQPAPSGFVLCQEQDSCGGSFSATQAWEGMVDDIRIFNMSLGEDQIDALSANMTDTIVSQETSVDDTWQACVRANDGVQASAQNCSNNLTITEPPVTCQIISSGGSYSLPSNAAGAPLSIYGPPESTKACVIIDSSNVEFSCNGYSFTNDGTLDAAAIILNGSTAIPYTNITIKDCPAISGYDQGIYLYDSTYITVQNSTLHNNTEHGFLSSYSNYTTISNSTMHNNSYGVYLEYSEYAVVDDSTANNNSVHGFYAEYSNNTNFTDVTSHNNTLDGLYLNESYDVLIDPSKFKDNKANGINLNNCDGVTLQDLTVTGNGANGIRANAATTIGLTNVNVSDNNGHGLHMVQSDDITISQSTFCSNHQYGIRSQLGSNIQVSTSDICSNTDHGVYLISTPGTTLDDDEIFGNGDRGVQVQNSANTFILDSHFYNNGHDLEVSENAANPSPFNLTNVVFDRPAGDYQSFTNLSINDTLDSYSYTINWSDDQPAEPPGYISFAQKYVNISTAAGVPSIDLISWKWSDAELGTYNQSEFRLWEHSGGVWTQLNDTPDTTAQILSLYDLTPASGYGILQKNVTNITVQLNTPSNGHLTTLTTITFNCSAASPQPMVNITLYGNWSGGWHENETKPLTGTYNSTTFTKTLPLGTYEWNCLAFDTLPDFDWGDTNFTFTLTNASGDVYALGGANVTVLNSSKYNGSDIGGTYELQGGNLTGADFNMRVSTEKWAGMYGNLTARLILSESNDTVFMYAWNWTPNAGGEVCLTQNAGPFWTAMAPTQKSYIDTAFGFNPSDSDSANNSLTDASVLINVANVSSATTGVHLSANSTFEMGAFQFVSNATGEADFAFCVNLTDGKNYRNQSNHFELVIPTTEEKGPGPLETYYVYVELN